MSLHENGFQNQQSILVCRWVSKKETYETHRLNKRRSGILRFMMGEVKQGLPGAGPKVGFHLCSLGPGSMVPGAGPGARGAVGEVATPSLSHVRLRMYV